MASTLPSPAATPPPETSHIPVSDSASPSSHSLTEKLDALLESHLTLLDAYTTLRAQLSTQFSNGFFSLAHANRNAASVLGAGRRFGEDGYDQRMKASRGIKIGRKSESTAYEHSDEEDNEDTSKVGEEQQATSEEKQQHDSDPQPHTPSSSPTNTHESPPSHPHLDHLTFTTISTKLPFSNPAPKDPLKWFTALPPQPLRQTQSQFTSAVSATIPSLLTTVSQMSALETMIWDVRGEMGILEIYRSNTEMDMDADVDAHVEGGKDEEEEEDDALAVKKQKPNDPEKDKAEANARASLPSPTKKQVLVARTAASGPRSRVMKMD